MPQSLRSAAAAAGLALSALALAACGRGDNQSANGNGADTTSADRSALTAAPVGSMKPQMDSALTAGKQRLDSLHAAGVTTKNGIDSVGSKVQATTANEPGHDTSHINNRATPGAGPAAPAAAGARRP